ncbi:hypothetical protein ACFLS4_00180 [Bacteroidota bacterium]
MPVLKENNKYKNAYEYVYYDMEGSQDYLQRLILLFDEKENKKQLIEKTKYLKEKSSNPLVFYK